MPIVADQKFGESSKPLKAIDVTWIIVAYEIAYLFGSFFVLPMINTFGRKKTVLIAISIDIAGSACFALLDLFTSEKSAEFLVCAITLRVLIGCSAALMMTPTGALLIEAAKKDDLESINGIYMACLGAGLILGPVIYAWFFSVVGFQLTMMIQATQLLVTGVVFYAFVHESPPEEN
jgi:MFS family permease